MLETLKDLTKKEFSINFCGYDSSMIIRMSHPDEMLTLTVPLLEEETEEEVIATLRRLEGKFYE